MNQILRRQISIAERHVGDRIIREFRRSIFGLTGTHLCPELEAEIQEDAFTHLYTPAQQFLCSAFAKVHLNQKLKCAYSTQLRKTVRHVFQEV